MSQIGVKGREDMLRTRDMEWTDRGMVGQTEGQTDQYRAPAERSPNEYLY